MITERFVIKSRMGLQLATAGKLVNKIQNHQCRIILIHNNMEYNVKSLLGLMCAGVRYGQEAMFVFDGDDEAEAFKTVASILNKEVG